MTAYFIAEIEITDPDAYARYARDVPATIARFSGEYVVRGGAITEAEGGWSPKRLVVLSFASLEAAKAWYNSPEYQAILPIRLAAARCRSVFVEGFTPPA
jgi:uncharacterized protein (DUF1330 family)